jgi:hypothetical protein
MSSSSDIDSGYDTASDCDADAIADDVYDDVVNILEGKAVGRAFEELMKDYHDRNVSACVCRGMVPKDADAYHRNLVLGTLEWYYGSDYAVTFVPLQLLEVPTHTQMSSMFPDERVPYLVQFRLMKNGFMDRLPRLEPIPV